MACTARRPEEHHRLTVDVAVVGGKPAAMADALETKGASLCRTLPTIISSTSAGSTPDFSRTDFAKRSESVRV